MMKVAYREERKPSSWVGALTVGEHEGRSEFSAILPGDHIHHSGGMFNRVVPKGSWHLLFGEVGAGHVYHDFPMRFNQPVGRLPTRRAGRDRRVVAVKERADRAAEELFVAVASELMSE